MQVIVRKSMYNDEVDVTLGQATKDKIKQFLIWTGTGFAVLGTIIVYDKKTQKKRT